MRDIVRKKSDNEDKAIEEEQQVNNGKSQNRNLVYIVLFAQLKLIESETVTFMIYF